MVKILFICYGNICRSPLSEFIMKELVEKKGISEQFEIASAAISREEIGNSVYPPIRKILDDRGIDCSHKRARQMTYQDYEYYDYLIGMDSSNYSRMMSMCKNDPNHKISLLMDYTHDPKSIADPWYTRDFQTTLKDVEMGCQAFLQYLIRKGDIHE